MFIYQFEEYIKPLKIIYPGFEYKNQDNTFNLFEFSLNELLERQRIYYHGPELRKIKYIPIVIFQILYFKNMNFRTNFYIIYIYIYIYINYITN